MNVFAAITEVVILIFNILIFMKLTILRWDNVCSKIIIYVSSFAMITAFFYGTYILGNPEAVTSFVCVTIPSAALFFIMSKYRDMRFFVTFCFLDTACLVVTFFSRAGELMFGKTVGSVCYVIAVVLIAFAYFIGRPYFSRYRMLMDHIKEGWGMMALSTFFVYILLIFTTTYPVPMIERTEYIPSYFLLCITIISFYAVMLLSMLQKKRINDLNVTLNKELKWHKVAYYDGLTKLRNRTSYIEKINEFERSAEGDEQLYAIMIDIDNFKKINDTLGHHVGDATLIKTAEFLNSVFDTESYKLFRIGGDEFAVVARNVSKEVIDEKVAMVADDENVGTIGCNFSVGVSKVKITENNAMENAFIRADSAMYQMKYKKRK